jgi:hypothetical protein
MQLTRPIGGILARACVLARCSAIAGSFFLIAPGTTGAQVSPQEILNPELRQLETTYLQQLKTLHHSIVTTKLLRIPPPPPRMTPGGLSSFITMAAWF